MLMPFVVAAQVPHAELDTAIIRIGEQVTVLLSVDLATDARGAAITWPSITGELAPHIEVVHIGEIDTLRTTLTGLPDMVHLARQIKITSFDTGFWAIPPFHFQIGGSAMQTAPMLLEVRGVELGDAPELRDIKGIHEVPFSLMAWMRANWYWFVLPPLIALLAWWLIGKWKQRKPREKHEEPVPELPLHERILIGLAELERERLWQNGAHKEYHSRLTDLLREYIEDRYRVPALERTTDELMHELRVSAISRDHRLQLQNMLQLSDMVKFAKGLPSPVENEQMMHNAIRFIQETAHGRSIPTHA